MEANPLLSEAGYEYVSDNDVYFLDMSLVESVPPDWRFAAHAEGSAVGVSLVALALLAWRVLYGLAGSELWESAVVRLLGFLKARVGGRLGPLPARFLPGSLTRLRDGTVTLMRLGLPASGTPWTTALAIAVSAPAVTLVVGWSLLWGDSGGKPVMLATLLSLVVVSLLVHHSGHAAVALRLGVRVHEAPWPMGIAQAVALIAIGGPAVAPMPAGIAEGVEGRKRAMVFLAGPLASLAFALLLFALYLAGSVPLLRLGATLNLSLAAVSLISLPPLDAAMVGEGRHTRWLVAAGVVLAVLAVLVSLSNQLYCLQPPAATAGTSTQSPDNPPQEDGR